MTSTHDLLAAICAQPQRDELRLAYAAACEAKEPAQANYIRHEVALAAGTIYGVAATDGITERLGRPFMEHCQRVTFSRGFVDEITIDPFIFIEHGAKLLEAAPIQSVIFCPRPRPSGAGAISSVVRVPSAIPELMSCALLERVGAIQFEDGYQLIWTLGQNDIEILLCSNVLGGLVWLGLPGQRAAMEDAYLQSAWTRAFERAEFRKLLVLGLPAHPGEGVVCETSGRTRVIEAKAMTEFGRTLEARHGYLPSLHLLNAWSGNPASSGLAFPADVVLAARRGELPRFAAGSSLTAQMNELPASVAWSNGTED